MIIDGHPVVRLGIKRLLEPDWDFEELTDGRGSVELLSSVGEIQVAIVEMRSAERGIPSGAATIRRMLTAHSGLGVIAHGGQVERHALGEAIDAGARAYVSKRSSPTTIRTAVDAVLAERPFIDPDADRRHATRPPITNRQREILQLFADGCSTDEAAKRLGLSLSLIHI